MQEIQQWQWWPLSSICARGIVVSCFIEPCKNIQRSTRLDLKLKIIVLIQIMVKHVHDIRGSQITARASSRHGKISSARHPITAVVASVNNRTIRDSITARASWRHEKDI